MRAVLFIVLFLAACTPVPRAPDLKSMVGVEDTRLAGEWQEVGAIGRKVAGTWVITPDFGGALFVESPYGKGTATLDERGKLSFDGFGQPLYLLWLDASDRTAILATKAGVAIVLDTSGPLPPDRAKAVADILEWNGFDPKDLT